MKESPAEKQAMPKSHYPSAMGTGDLREVIFLRPLSKNTCNAKWHNNWYLEDTT